MCVCGFIVCVCVCVFIVPGTPTGAEDRGIATAQPVNLLGTLLSFSSIVLQNIKGMDKLRMSVNRRMRVTRMHVAT